MRANAPAGGPATPAVKKPANIFPQGTSQNVHKIQTDAGTYGASVNGNTVKYQTYVIHTAGTHFDVAAPVKCLVASVKNSGNNKKVLIQFLETIGLYKAGDYMSISALSGSISIGHQYKKGAVIGSSSDNTVSIAMNPSGAKNGRITLDGAADPAKFVDYAQGVADAAGNPTSATGTNNDSSSAGGTDVGSIAKAAAFSTFFTMPGIFNTFESQNLTGQRSLMNDQPLMPFIQQLCGACLRHFMSTPTGDFFAFYPDYFGGLGKTAYWFIEDIEVMNGSIELSDDQLATHVYVVGDIVGAPSGALGGNGIDTLDRLNTGGVVTIFNAFMADFLNGTDVSGAAKVDKTKYPTLADKADAIAFLQKYGARPYYEEQPTVRAPIYEAFLAYQKFCLKWSDQFKTTFEFTFMPELYPGGLVAFPEHGLQCYVNSVTHNCSYETGFTTTAELSAPSAFKGGDGNPLDPDKAWVHAGMIRSWPTDDNVGTFTGATDTDPAQQKTKGKGKK
jgi:hypothetical protein